MTVYFEHIEQNGFHSPIRRICSLLIVVVWPRQNNNKIHFCEIKTQGFRSKLKQYAETLHVAEQQLKHGGGRSSGAN